VDTIATIRPNAGMRSGNDLDFISESHGLDKDTFVFSSGNSAHLLFDDNSSAPSTG